MASPWYGLSTANHKNHDEGRSASEKPHMQSKPSLKDLMNELDTVINWQRLMISLDMENSEIRKIEKNFPNDFDQQKQEAFDKWLRMKPDACWKQIIDALYEMKEVVLALDLEKKYNWRDPRIFIRYDLLSASPKALITAEPLGDNPIRKFLPPLDYYGQEYFRLKSRPSPGINASLAAGRTQKIFELMQRRRHKLFNFLKSIQDSKCKADFRVGLEMRFGRVYYKMDPKSCLSQNLTKNAWIKSNLLQKSIFQTEIDKGELDKLFKGRQQLGKEVIRIKLNFIVEGQGAGTYSAVVSTIDDGDQFFLDAVYRQKKQGKSAKIDIALPDMKYDFRISECCECTLLEEHPNSIPYQMARTIVQSLRQLPNRSLHLILRGQSQNKRAMWKVQHIRQCVQRQYEWKPQKRWILAQYKVDAFDCKTNKTVNVDTATLDKGVNISEFDYSRYEVELWGQKIFPKNVNDTRPSRNKYYYMEGIHGVTLSKEPPRDPYDWTTEGLLSDFEEFLGDAFKIVYILDGSPY